MSDDDDLLRDAFTRDQLITLCQYEDPDRFSELVHWSYYPSQGVEYIWCDKEGKNHKSFVFYRYLYRIWGKIKKGVTNGT